MTSVSMTHQYDLGQTSISLDILKLMLKGAVFSFCHQHDVKMSTAPTSLSVTHQYYIRVSTAPASLGS